MKLTPKQRMQAYDVVIGEALAKARKSKGMSLQEAADRVHKSKQTIFNYERGQRSLNASDFLVYCNVLGFDGMKILIDVQNTKEEDLVKAYSAHFSDSLEVE